jgi:hypothetical protein
MTDTWQAWADHRDRQVTTQVFVSGSTTGNRKHDFEPDIMTSWASNIATCFFAGIKMAFLYKDEDETEPRLKQFELTRMPA